MSQHYQITPIPAFQDNYIWLIDDGQAAVCVDPGEASPILEALQQQNLNLEQIWTTHYHNDHTGGIQTLKQHYPNCVVYGASDIANADIIVQDNSQIQWRDIKATIWQTAGHTEQHICYLAEIENTLRVFCGDTLFSAGCGRAFTGKPEWLYQSFQKLNTLPENTLFYPAHEYTESNLRFAQSIEPNNPNIQAALANIKQHQPSLPTSLANERLINPFLRINQADVIQAAIQKTACPNNPEAVFIALRQLKDQF